MSESYTLTLCYHVGKKPDLAHKKCIEDNDNDEELDKKKEKLWEDTKKRMKVDWNKKKEEKKKKQEEEEKERKKNAKQERMGKCLPLVSASIRKYMHPFPAANNAIETHSYLKWKLTKAHRWSRCRCQKSRG